jgi:hypothetical protein
MNAIAASKSSAQNGLEGFALTTILLDFPAFAAAALLLKFARHNIAGGVVLFVVLTSVLHGLFTPWLAPLSSSVDRQKLQRLFAGRKAPEFAVVGIVLGRLRRPKHHELTAFLLDQGGQFFTRVRCHVARAAMRAFVVAHAGPFIGPSAPASITFVEIEEPGHASLLGSQTIISARNELNKSAVSQVLKLLAYLGFDVLVVRIEVTEVPLEGVDLF